MKILRSTVALLSILAALSVPVTAQTTLSTGHADIGVAVEDDAFFLHVHQAGPTEEDEGTEYLPSEAILEVGPDAFGTVPASASFSFLGTAGSPVYILPAVPNPNLLFLGWGTEEIAPGVLLGDQLTMTLSSFTGPGSFALYQTDVFGTPTVFMNTGDGLSSGDVVTLLSGGHSHFNMAFSQPGTYELTLTAAGSLADLTPLSSTATYTFNVVPEPSTWAMMAVGVCAVAGMSWRRRLRPSSMPR